jgi:hypothetical protein
MKNILLIAVILAVVFSFNSADCQVGSLPKELLEIAKKNGCNEVVGFYDRPGMVNPPYVYGYLPGPEENSAAFWCEKKQGERRLFFLMFMTRGDAREQMKCSDKIEWKITFPGGLSIWRDMNTTYEGFEYIDDSKKELPKKNKLAGNAVLSEYSGVELLFYCYKGQWIVRIRD